MKRLFDQFTYNLQIRYKLILSYLLILMMPFLLLTVYSHQGITGVLLDQAKFSALQMLDQTRMALENTMNRYDVLTLSLSNLENFSTIQNNAGGVSANEMIREKQALEKAIYTFIGNTEHNGVKLYFPDSFTLLTNGQTYFNFEDVKDQQWFIKLVDGFKRNLTSFSFCSASELEENEYIYSQAKVHPRLVSFARIIKSPVDYTDYIGVLRVDVPEKSLARVLGNNNLFAHSLALLTTVQGEILCTSTLPAGLDGAGLEPALFAPDAGWADVSLANQDYYMRSAAMEKYGLKLINLIPRRDVFASVLAVQRNVLLISLMGILFAVVAALGISGPMNWRLRRFVRAMQSIKTGKLEKVSAPIGQDEIGILAGHYNLMVDEMQALARRQYQDGQELKNAELRLLQAQINPHFLYNTLDMIGYLGKNNRTDEVQQAVIELVRFYRLSLSGGADTITIDAELKHVQHYIRLQNMRYGGAITLMIDADEDVRHATILKMTLQPIVENAINHGIMEKEKKLGSVDIAIRREAEDLVITIADDGVGMDESACEAILTKPSANPESGFGAMNVNTRLRIFYGESYGLSYQNRPGGGTIATVRLPG